MSAMTRGLFLQLPPPRFRFEDPPSNIPLAAGFLSAALDECPSRSAGAEILEPDVVDVLADEGLAQEIARRRPAALGMSLYLWNAQRSLFLASNMKKLNPGTLVLVGGPEVTPDNEWVLEHPAVDGGIFGEGESRIAMVLAALLQGQGGEAIPGTFFKRDGRVMANREAPEPWPLDRCDYPYIGGRIGPSRDGTIFLETVRGCAFKCRYCYYHKAFSGIRPHSRTSVAAVLDMAYSTESRIREIYLMDPTFNARRGFRELLAEMAARRARKDVAIHTELRGDFLRADDVALLKEAGLASAEVGLQSTNPAALRAAGRHGKSERVAHGVSLLKQAGIKVTTGIILGLPEDTPEGFRSTLDWLKRTQAYSEIQPFVLSVLPGTDFRACAPALGLAHDRRPPYYVHSTPTFPEDELRHALEEFESVLDVELDRIPLPSLVDRGPIVVFDPEDCPYVSKWIVDPGRASDPDRLLPRLLPRVTDPFTLWFRGTCAEEVIGRILAQFTFRNPHAVLHMVWEFVRPPRVTFLEDMIQSAANPSLYVNRSYAPLIGPDEAVSPVLTVVFPDPGEDGVREALLAEYGHCAEIVWDIGSAPHFRSRPSPVPLLVSATRSGIGNRLNDLFRELERICGDDPEQILFRDWALQQEWNLTVRQADTGSQREERILVKGPEGS